MKVEHDCYFTKSNLSGLLTTTILYQRKRTHQLSQTRSQSLSDYASSKTEEAERKHVGPKRQQK